MNCAHVLPATEYGVDFSLSPAVVFYALWAVVSTHVQKSSMSMQWRYDTFITQEVGPLILYNPWSVHRVAWGDTTVMYVKVMHGIELWMGSRVHVSASISSVYIERIASLWTENKLQRNSIWVTIEVNVHYVLKSVTAWWAINYFTRYISSFGDVFLWWTNFVLFCLLTIFLAIENGAFPSKLHSSTKLQFASSHFT
jgi:hypothetical protein